MPGKLKQRIDQSLPTQLKSALHIIQHIINNRELRTTKQFWDSHRLRTLLRAGQVAIIPVGFRCHTKAALYLKLGISQPSLPFDCGFFPPNSVSKILRTQRVNLDYDSHAVCIKHENYTDRERVLGIRFESSSYSEIDSLAISTEQPDLNQYLDSTFGYYTLDREFNYVLAHYNWHAFAGKLHAGSISTPQNHLRQIRSLLNRRIQRLVDMCTNARLVFFVYGENQGYSYMDLDGTSLRLNVLKSIEAAANHMFSAKSVAMHLDQITSPSHMMQLIKENL